jgi:HAD superfamily hydrolase (TIGR01490 family)
VHWRDKYLTEKIDPILLSKARDLLEEHRARGDELLIITATNRFITEPIALRYGVAELLATEPEIVNGEYTGGVSGTPCFQAGKVERLNTWLEQNQRDLQGSWFYSDSHNDLPLLERVDNPVAVDPDTRLKSHAHQRGWPVISLR